MRGKRLAVLLVSMAALVFAFESCNRAISYRLFYESFVEETVERMLEERDVGK